MGEVSLKRLLQAAALAALLAGIVLTLMQQLQVVPLILQAEQLEHATAADSHEHGEWQPQAGTERLLYTAAANIVSALGFALLLGAAIALRNSKLNGVVGLAWGVAGYATFFLAPSLGLPPELPGTESAEILHRQTWWIATVACTAVGLALLFTRRSLLMVIGCAALLSPHLFGAPQPEAHGALAPPEMSQAFVRATHLANAAFWLVLGCAYGFFYRRIVKKSDHREPQQI